VRRYNDTLPNLAVVIPSYKAVGTIDAVIKGLPETITHIIIVDDGCPQKTGTHVSKTITDTRITVIHHPENQGVGAASLTGFTKAFDLGADIALKMDSDDQHDPAYIDALIIPLTQGRADYTKGSRFLRPSDLKDMPRLRIFLNAILSFTNKFASGYYSITDPTNGFVAITRAAFETLPRDKIAKRYFFESDILHHLNLQRSIVSDIPIHIRYRGEESDLKLRRELFSFTVGNIRNFFRRIWVRHFIMHFSLPAIYLSIGLLFIIFSLVFGIPPWLASINTGIPAPFGTVIIPALLAILGVNMLTSFFLFDVNDEPK